MMVKIRIDQISLISTLFITVLFASCKYFGNEVNHATKQMSVKTMKSNIMVLASDEFQGRKPCTPGEDKTIDFLIDEFNKLGLEPANRGSYIQEVPLVEISAKPDETMTIRHSWKSLSLNYKDDFVAFSRKMTDRIELNNTPIVFAGFGIHSEEFDWNDFEAVDVKDKIIIVLVNDPGFYQPENELFKGNEMTYYGRWTYKYEEAAEQGAAGVLIIHDDKPAGYPWSVVLNGAIIPKLYLQPDDNYENRCELEGWLSNHAAEELLDFCGYDLQELIKKAASPGFIPFEMNASLSFNMELSDSLSTSKNVLGFIPGKKRPEEVIIYTAHWDHLGIGNPINGDSIYNGAVDNGTSLAWMFEIARGFKSLRKAPDRSVMFIATTAEEQGLLGADYYVKNPVFDICNTVANINNDLMLPFGRYKDVMITGYGQSTLEDLIEKHAKLQDRYVLPDPNPHTGMYYRADHFPFAKAGVPALFARGNCDSREFGKEWALEMEDNWLKNYYHKPADEYDAKFWDLSGTLEDAKLMFRLGYELANSDLWPEWKATSEFKSTRDECKDKKQ